MAKSFDQFPLLDGHASNDHQESRDPGYGQESIRRDQCIPYHRHGKSQVEGMPYPAIRTVGDQSGIASGDYRVGQIVTETTESPDEQRTSSDTKTHAAPPRPVW